MKAERTPLEIWAMLDAGERNALVTGVGLDRGTLASLGLIKRAYRTNRNGETKFCGRRTPLGRAVAAAGQEVSRG